MSYLNFPIFDFKPLPLIMSVQVVVSLKGKLELEILLFREKWFAQDLLQAEFILQFLFLP